MKKQEQTILTTHSKGIDSVGEPGAPASLGVLKEEARAWHTGFIVQKILGRRPAADAGCR
jgi:hypothetical protein